MRQSRQSAYTNTSQEYKLSLEIVGKWQDEIKQYTEKMSRDFTEGKVTPHTKANRRAERVTMETHQLLHLHHHRPYHL